MAFQSGCSPAEAIRVKHFVSGSGVIPPILSRASAWVSGSSAWYAQVLDVAGRPAQLAGQVEARDRLAADREELTRARVQEDGVEVLVHADDSVCHSVAYRTPALLLVPDLLEGAFERGGHRVERGAQRAHLVLHAGLDPLVEVSRG